SRSSIPIGMSAALPHSRSRSSSVQGTRSCRNGWGHELIRLGAHMSVAGGLPRAVERAVAHRCDAFQIFAKNANQWHGRSLATAEIREFRAKVEEAGIGPVVSHASYLINLATTSSGLHQQSMDAMG